MKNKNVIVIGGGPAGIEAAYNLALNNCNVIVLEKEAQIGGNINNVVKLFPSFVSTDEIKENLSFKSQHENIKVFSNTEITKLYYDNNLWCAKTASGETYTADAVLLASGFKTFDARFKEELGYGIYNGVITSVELEAMFRTGKITTSEGKTPQRIAFLNCVGSRDEKVGNHYCSRVCCINAVKQSISIKELLPETEIFCFYMDIRMAGQFYEELYRKSQEKHNVNYIRGRISEAAATIDNRVQIKCEDTLNQLPMKMTVDLLVLMVGTEASDGTTNLGEQVGVKGEYGFAKSLNLHASDNHTNKEGLFLAGSCKRPLTLPETMADSRAAAFQIINFLNQN